MRRRQEEGMADAPHVSPHCDCVSILIHLLIYVLIRRALILIRTNKRRIKYVLLLFSIWYYYYWCGNKKMEWTREKVHHDASISHLWAISMVLKTIFFLFNCTPSKQAAYLCECRSHSSWQRYLPRYSDVEWRLYFLLNEWNALCSMPAHSQQIQIDFYYLYVTCDTIKFELWSNSECVSNKRHRILVHNMLGSRNEYMCRLVAAYHMTFL